MDLDGIIAWISGYVALIEDTMSEDALTTEFNQLMERSRARKEISELPTEQERRAFPRLKIESSDLWIDSIAQFDMVDMSPSGVALHCNHPIEVGKVLEFTLDEHKGVKARVAACELVESPTEYLDAQYRVQCEFLAASKAMALILGAKRDAK